MGIDVFISYSSKDSMAAKATCAALEAAKIRCWMAPRDIVPGSPWGASIVRAIEQCRIMVLIFSQSANGSSQVHREVDQAFGRGKAVLPLRIEQVEPGDELAYYLDTVHWLDAMTAPMEKNLQKLVAAVQSLLPQMEPESVSSAPASDEAEVARKHDVARAEDTRNADESLTEQRDFDPSTVEAPRHYVAAKEDPHMARETAGEVVAGPPPVAGQRPPAPPVVPPQAAPSSAPADGSRQRPAIHGRPRARGGFATLLIGAGIVGVVAMIFIWQWPHTQQQARSPSAPAPADVSSSPTAVLNETDPIGRQAKRFVGSAIWHADAAARGEQPAVRDVRADITIPDLGMTVTWKMAPNTDKTLPASHTIDIEFKLPPKFPNGAIANVSGMLMKSSELGGASPLGGQTVKVANSYFLVGLAADDAGRILQLNWDWFDIPIVYTNGVRAALSVKKGTNGNLAFIEALTAWPK